MNRGENKRVSRVDCPPLPYSASILLATPHFKIKVPFLCRFGLFSWKNARFIEKSFLSQGKSAVSMRKVPLYCKERPLTQEIALKLEKKCPLAWKKVSFCSKKCPFLTCPPLPWFLIFTPVDEPTGNRKCTKVNS